MTTRSSDRRSSFRSSWAFLGAAWIAAACSTDGPTGSAPPLDTGRIGLLTVTAGTRVTAVISVPDVARGTGVIALEGRLRFDPAALKYVGQEVGDRTILLVGEGELAAGIARFALLDRGPLGPRAAVFAFERIGPDLDPRVSVEITHAGDATGRSVRQLLGHYASVPAVVRGAADPRRMTVADWFARYHAPNSERPGLELVPGQGTIYGDVNLNGIVNLFDVIVVLNVAAGAQPLLTDVTRDLPVAGDVAPANSPGLGESSDPIPPGLEADGSRQINVFDAIAIQNAAAGVTEPVAGHPIPGRTPATDRTVLSGVLLADRTLSRDTVYELDGMVIVTSGAVLRIPAGTRIEGNSTTRGALSVRRGSQIIITGTRLEPVVMTCTAAVKSAGCWGGLQINGAASLNNGNTGGGNTLQCPELTAPGGYGIYGGCVEQSSSGGITYLRIEYAGAPAGSTPIAGLQLLGVGSGTILEDIEVLRAAGTGAFVSGGRAQIRQLVLADNGGVAFDWDDGWSGKAQQLLIARGLQPGIGIRGSNAPPGTVVVGQTATPMLFNVTVVGTSVGGTGSAALLLHQGTGGLLRNLLVQGVDGPGLDINDSATCAAVTGGMLQVMTGLFWQNTPDFSADVDCIDEVAFAADPAQAITVVDPQLIGPAVAASPDLRPAFGSPAANGAMPPADGFFDPSLTYLGAVPPAGMTSANIPWYAGWIVGWN